MEEGSLIETLHRKYVPLLRFASGERFYPMAVDDFVGYCTLQVRGSRSALAQRGRVTPSLLATAQDRGIDAFLQSVPASLTGQSVTSRWSSDVFKTLVDVSRRAPFWQAELARVAYDWFSAKTQSATQLFWWNDLVMPLMGMGKRAKQDLPRLDLPPELRQAAIDNYEQSQLPTPQYTYYYRTTRDAKYLCLQYWFFYSYNDWATGFDGMNDHEGDWEGLYLFFDLDSSGRPKEPPAYITYVGHRSRLTKPWGHHDVTLVGTHPVAYVAAGSHATYPERKDYDLMKIYGLVDYARGDGLTIEPDDWRRQVDLESQPWTVAFLGAWGTRYWLPSTWARRVVGVLQAQIDQFGLPGISAPRGPRYTDDGSIRPSWGSVVSWAGIFDFEGHLAEAPA